MYPEVAIIELIANALIHQDFAEIGTGPMVEIFSTKIWDYTTAGPKPKSLLAERLSTKSKQRLLHDIIYRIHPINIPSGCPLLPKFLSEIHKVKFAFASTSKFPKKTSRQSEHLDLKKLMKCAGIKIHTRDS